MIESLHLKQMMNVLGKQFGKQNDECFRETIWKAINFA